MNFWQSVVLILEVFLFFAYLLVLFHIIGDLFRDTRMGGFAKAVWIFFLILVPVLTSLVYLIARGGGMADRQAAAVARAQARTDAYIRDVAGSSVSQELATAKELVDSGAITPAEFAQIKDKVLSAL